MIDVYSYTEEDLGFSFVGGLRFDVCRQVSPDEAKLFIVPPVIGHIINNHKQDIHKLKYVDRGQHVFWDVTDFHKTFPKLSQHIFLRAMVNRYMLTDNPLTQSIPWPAEDLGHISRFPESGFKYDVSFHGWSSCPERTQSADSCKSQFGHRADIVKHETFYAYYDEKERSSMRSAFLRSLHYSKIILAYPSVYQKFLPYRFYEALSAGRLPATSLDGQVFPFEDKIDWGKLIVEIPKESPFDAGQHIQKFLERTSDSEFLRRCAYARQMWLEYLDSTYWPRIHRTQVEAML